MKRQEEVKELRGLGEEEIAKKVLSSQEELMKLRFRHGAGQLEQTGELKKIRRKIARAKTIFAEKAKKENQGGDA